jgi:GR25 family glycosyltransferase involved in LPS biosynthesis
MKAFVMRKKDDVLSERLADECIASGKKFGIDIEKFDGIYSDHDAILAKEGLFPHQAVAKKLRNGYRGCFLSHYLVWKKAIEFNEPILVLEHDAVVLRPLPENILSMFDTLLVLDRFSREKNYEELLTAEFPLKIHKHEKLSEVKNLDKQVNKTHIRGAHGVLIKPQGAMQLIDSIKKHGYLISDVAINQCYMTYYSIEPTIVRVNPYFTLGAHRGDSHCKIL